MKNNIFILCTLITLFCSCEAHISVEGSGKTFCDCADVNFRWTATDQNGDPLDNVLIATPGSVETHGATGTYEERICESHTYQVKAVNHTVSKSWPPIVYEKLTEPREFPLTYTCGEYIPFLTGDEPETSLMGELKVLRICNSYTHKSLAVHGAGWSLVIPPGGCTTTEAFCESINLGRYQGWTIEDGPITDPSVIREECNLSGDVAPPPGVIDPGPLVLRVLVACSCEG